MNLLPVDLFLSLLSLSTLISLSSTAKPLSKPECEKKLHQVDEAVAKISIALAKDARPFTSVKDFSQNYCGSYAKWVKELLSYRSCMKPFPRQIVTMIGTSLRRGGKRFCSTPERQAVVVKHSQCFTNESLPGVRLAMNKAIVAIEYVVNEMPEKELIPALCCSYLEMVIQGTNDIERVCSPVSGRGTGKFLIDGVITASGEAMELMCGQYTNMRTCERKEPHITAKVKAAITRNLPIYNYTPIVSLLNFVKKYDSDIHIT